MKWRFFSPEVGRWGFCPLFFICVAASAVCTVLDVLPTEPIGVNLLDGQVYDTLTILIGTCDNGLLKLAGLCFCALPAAGIFAEDYGENAVYMRVQRLGFTRYALGRVGHAAVSAWLVGFFAEIISMIILVMFFGQNLFPATGITGKSLLLGEGKNISFCFIMAGICGLRAVFYAMAALAFSVFVPDRGAVAAVPLLLYYFNQYMLPRFPQVPVWMRPSIIYAKDNRLAEMLGISEWQGFFLELADTLFIVLLTFLLLREGVVKNRTFGGKIE